MAKHRSTEEWSDIVAAYENRSCTQAQFCEHHGISPAALGYHRRKRQAREPAGSSKKRDSPQIIELPPPDPVLSRVGNTTTELSMEHGALGKITVRCRPHELSTVIAQLAQSL